MKLSWCGNASVCTSGENFTETFVTEYWRYHLNFLFHKRMLCHARPRENMVICWKGRVASRKSKFIFYAKFWFQKIHSKTKKTVARSLLKGRMHVTPSPPLASFVMVHQHGCHTIVLWISRECLHTLHNLCQLRTGTNWLIAQRQKFTSLNHFGLTWYAEPTWFAWQLPFSGLSFCFLLQSELNNRFRLGIHFWSEKYTLMGCLHGGRKILGLGRS